jgi:hypothetical protein
LTTFCGCFTSLLPLAERKDYVQCIQERIRPQLCDASGNWTADYVRLGSKRTSPRKRALR